MLAEQFCERVRGTRVLPEFDLDAHRVLATWAFEQAQVVVRPVRRLNDRKPHERAAFGTPGMPDDLAGNQGKLEITHTRHLQSRGQTQAASATASLAEVAEAANGLVAGAKAGGRRC